VNCDSRQEAGNHGEGSDRVLAAIPCTSYACRRGSGFSHGFRIGDSRQFRFDVGALTELPTMKRLRARISNRPLANIAFAVVVVEAIYYRIERGQQAPQGCLDRSGDLEDIRSYHSPLSLQPVARTLLP
jgi:hypothetical protein